MELDIKVNVPKGFIAVYQWVDGDLIISIERAPVALIHKAKKGTGRGYVRYGKALTEWRGVKKNHTVKSDSKEQVVVSVVTSKKPTISQSSTGTGSTGPKKVHDAES